MNNMRKLTGEEIMSLIENSGIEVSEYAYEGISDFDVFNDYSEELKVHIEKTKDLSYSDRKKYEEFVLNNNSLYSLKQDVYSTDVASVGGHDDLDEAIEHLFKQLRNKGYKNI